MDEIEEGGLNFNSPFFYVYSMGNNLTWWLESPANGNVVHL